MAKAPRRRGRDRDDGKKKPRAAKPVKPPVARPAKPAAAKPVKPAAAKPVKPPAAAPVAKPVQPAKPPAAAPVAKPVQPAKPPAAAPVAKAPAAKPAAPPAKPAGGKRGPAKRMAEEELGGRRGGRGQARGGGYSRGGMGIGGKVGVLAALVTFLIIGGTVFLSRSKDPNEGKSDGMNAFGLTAVSALATPDAKWYRGGASGQKGRPYFEKAFTELLGSKGKEFWDKRIAELSQPPPRDMSMFAKQQLEEDQKRFNKAADKYFGSGGGLTGKKHIQARLSQVWNEIFSSEGDRYQVHRAWIREVGKGDEPNGGRWLAATRVSQNAIEYSAEGWKPAGGGFSWTNGKVDGDVVRIYQGQIRGVRAAKPLLAFVSVFDSGKTGGGSGPGLGMLMLIIGPLVVGFTAYAVANGHTKNVRSLARDIDRLGSSGDPTREIRAQGAEANAVARSVERMVANLEFRDKHDGADLDEVISKEQKVAEEIHGALISKNPPRLSNYEVETLFKPGFEIGGDHFEYFPIDENHLGIILLDTNVRGIPAALVMAQAKSYLRAAAPGVLSPAVVLKQVNRHLAGELPPGRHVTALYVVLNQSDGSATIASAGHLPLLVYRHASGKMAKVNPEGIALGLDAGPVFERTLEEGDIPIGVGDRIVLYTDGALMIQNEEGDEFGEQRFYGAVTQEAPKNSQAFVNFVGAAIDRFHLEVPQNDDITISTVKRLR